jgi:tRNA modification GTPase
MTSGMKPTDTIAALATPPGPSALAILRLSGPEALSLVQTLMADERPCRPQHARHVTLRQAGQVLDDAVVTWWRGPRSSTGEDVVEISCHGSPLIIGKILAALYALGARPARPGEFTERAFLNGKLDLTQAEAVADLIQAETEPALAGARDMLEGKLGTALQSLRRELIDLLAHLEAFIDFPEEGIAPDTGHRFATRLAALTEQIRQWRDTASLGRILREGLITALVGEPNVGKSSLLNALLREDRAIVAPTPGTTRDTIEAECDLHGLRLRLIDTAGRRETGDAIEAEGVRRAQAAAAQAHLILHVVEAHRPRTNFPPPVPLPGQAMITVANKADLGFHPDHAGALPVSTLGPPGLAALEAELAQRFLQHPAPQASGWLTVNARQNAALGRAADALDRSQAGLAESLPPELISIDLRHALAAVGDAVGLATHEDVLDALFAQFCIGK